MGESDFTPKRRRSFTHELEHSYDIYSDDLDSGSKKKSATTNKSKTIIGEGNTSPKYDEKTLKILCGLSIITYLGNAGIFALGLYLYFANAPLMFALVAGVIAMILVILSIPFGPSLGGKKKLSLSCPISCQSQGGVIFGTIALLNMSGYSVLVACISLHIDGRENACFSLNSTIVSSSKENYTIALNAVLSCMAVLAINSLITSILALREGCRRLRKQKMSQVVAIRDSGDAEQKDHKVNSHSKKATPPKGENIENQDKLAKLKSTKYFDHLPDDLKSTLTRRLSMTNAINDISVTYTTSTSIAAGPTTKSIVTKPSPKEDIEKNAKSRIEGDKESGLASSIFRNSLDMNIKTNSQQCLPSPEQSDERDAIVDEINEDEACVICLENPKNVVLLPCLHVCLCSSCLSSSWRQDGTGSLRECPLCRVPIEKANECYL